MAISHPAGEKQEQRAAACRLGNSSSKARMIRERGYMGGMTRAVDNNPSDYV